MPTIYLSPSLQPGNLYTGGGNEQDYMNQVADAMEPYLQTNGILFTRSKIGMSLGAVIRQSNEKAYDFHLAIHSNAAPERLSGQLQGTDVYYYTYSRLGKIAAELFAEQFRTIYPDPSRVQIRPTTTLAEVTKTNAPAILIEVAYHDNREDADWIRGHIPELAETLVKSLTLYFGIPFLSPPQKERKGVVQTKGGSLNLRYLPSPDGVILNRILNGTQLPIYASVHGWYVTAYQGQSGYVSQNYVEIQA